MSSALRDENGLPVEGATITWTPLLAELLGTWVGWAGQDWGAVDRMTLTTTSQPDGVFVFSQGIAVESSTSALWITHPRFMSKVQVFDDTNRSEDAPPSIELQSAPVMSVRVLTPDGHAGAQAIVEQFEYVESGSTADRHQPQAARILKRTVSTDSNGVAAVAALTGKMVLRAHLGSLHSEPWTGPSRADLTLTLRSSFQAFGSVTYDPASTFDGAQHIVCSFEEGGQRVPLAIAPVAAGAWGPIEVPHMPSGQYVFRLEGWGAEVREKRLRNVVPLSKHRVDFHAKKGLEAAAIAYDEANELVRTAVAEFSWYDGGTLVTERAHAADSDLGYMYVNDIPPGTAFVHVSAPGFVPQRGDPIAIDGSPLFATTFVLKRAGNLAGRVTYKSRPVEDFEVTSWQPAPIEAISRSIFRAREDGTFEVFDAPTGGQLHVVASSTGHGPSTPVVVSLSPGASVSELELELTDGLEVKGKIVDGQDLHPLDAATIQPFLAQLTGSIAPTGAPHASNAAGEFVLNSLGPGRFRIRFSADGYAPTWLEVLIQDPGSTDLGLIALSRTQTMRAQLEHDGSVDLTSVSLRLTGDESYPEVYFDARGSAEVRDVAPGSYLLRVGRDVGEQRLGLYMFRRHFEPGSAWVVRIPAPGSTRLQVQVLLEHDLDRELVLYVEQISPEGQKLVCGESVVKGQTAEMYWLRPGDFEAQLYDPAEATTLAIVRDHIGPNDSDVRITLSPSGRRNRFRVVNSKGLPIASATLGLRKPGENWKDITNTNTVGECTLIDLEPGDYAAYVSHGDYGYAYDLPVSVRSDSEFVHEVELDPKLAVEILLQDDSDPLPGVTCKLWASEKQEIGQAAASTNSLGVARWTYFTPGKFFIKVDHPGYWSTSAWVPSQEPGAPTPIQVRRVGNLDVLVKNSSGLAVAGQPLQLRSNEFSADVAVWLKESRITASSSTLTTDGQGKLHLQGLPRGDYTWTVQNSGGEALQGLVKVPPHATSTATIFVP